MGDGIETISGLLALLQRRKYLMFVIVSLIFGGTLVGMLASQPAYTATALLQVDTSRKDLLAPDGQATASASDSARIDSEVELVKAEATLLRVVETLGLHGDPDFQRGSNWQSVVLTPLGLARPAPDNPAQAALEVLREIVSVQRRGLTSLIAVQARWTDPQRAAELANAVAAGYIEAQVDRKVAGTRALRGIVATRLTEASAAVAASERAFDTFLEGNLEQISAETGRTDIRDLGRRLDAANAERTATETLVAGLDYGLARRDWQGLAEKLGATDGLATERRALQARLDAAGTSAGADDLRRALAELDERIADAARLELTALQQRLAATRLLAADIRSRLRVAVLDAHLSAEVLTDLYALQQNAEIARTQYQTLLGRLRDLEAQSDLQVADSRMVSPALPPQRPSGPGLALVLTLAALAALIVSIGGAVLAEAVAGGFTSTEQLRLLLDATTTVPRTRDGKNGVADGIGVANRVIVAPLSAFAEGVRRVRLALDQALSRTQPDGKAADGGAVVMVTSAAPTEGKTTVALSIARAYALAGRSTLLIDCDLRKPGLHWQLGLEPSTGLLDYLSNSTNAPPLSSIMTVDERSGTQVIVGARRSDGATDQLLSGETFARLLAAARANFDIIVLDTAPVGAVVDALYLLRQTDVVAFVVRWASTPQQVVRGAIRALQDARRPGTELVAVLNRHQLSRLDYQQSYTEYYSEV